MFDLTNNLGTLSDEVVVITIHVFHDLGVWIRTPPREEHVLPWHEPMMLYKGDKFSAVAIEQRKYGVRRRNTIDREWAKM